ncbi:HEAT repeat domain-containing protein [Halobaculum sp. MBLA0147]|uniref:HEAT repeat domain-containing protein n=1 Tax=Halobaculum sp. MBLA0147 TaxID=3079934 RepID=UPI003525AA98
MSRLRPPHLLPALTAGRVDPADAIDAGIDALDAASDPIREWALETLVEATRTEPDRIADVADAVETSFGPGRNLTDSELTALRALGVRRPRAFEPSVERLGTALATPDETGLDLALVARFLGDIGAEAPGVVKPVLGSLVDLVSHQERDVATTAAWAVVRVAAADPAMLRPVVAGRVWSLDADDPTTVATALETLGRVGAILPHRLAGVDRIVALTEHTVPAVRVAAVEALAETAGTTDDGLGVPAPERVSEFHDEITALLDDPVSDVRHAALDVLEQCGDSDPAVVHDRIDDVVARTTDSDPAVRRAALDALSSTLDPRVVDVRRLVSLALTRLTDEETEVAAVELLVALADALPDDHLETVLVTDALIWYEFLSSPPFGAPAPLDAVEGAGDSVPTPSRYLDVATSLRDADTEEYRHGSVQLLGLVARCTPRRRLRAIGSLQAALADETAAVRRRVLSEFEALVEAAPAVSPVIAPIAQSVHAYDPQVRDAAASVLVACDRIDADRLERATAVQCDIVARELRSETEPDDGDGLDSLVDEALSGESSTGSGVDTLQTLVRVAPRPVAAAAPSLLDAADPDNEAVEALALTLARATATATEAVPPPTDVVDAMIQSSDASPRLVARLSTLLIVGSHDDETRSRAVDRLHSVFERRGGPAATGCLELLAAHEPRVTSRLLVTLPPLQSVRTHVTEPLTECVTGHPRLSLQCRDRTGPYTPRQTRRDRSVDPDTLAEIAADAPQTVPATATARDGLCSGDGGVTATLLRATGSLPSIPNTDEAVWTRHPNAETRRVARDRVDSPSGSSTTPPQASPEIRPRSVGVDSRGSNSEPAGDPKHGDNTVVDPTCATRTTVDELATRVAAPQRAVSQTASERLVTIGARRPALRPYVRQHLLASVGGLEDVVTRESVLGALVTLAPRGPSDLSTTADSSPATRDRQDGDTLGSTLVQYARFGTPATRDTALCALQTALGSLVGAVDTRVFVERLRDPDDVVRARTARTLADHVGDGVTVTDSLVDALVDALDGPRHVAIACCVALGRVGVVHPPIRDRVVAALERHLTSRARGVRRAAATALARLGRSDPGSLRSASDTLVGRLREDDAVQPEIVPAVATLPQETLPRPDWWVRRLFDVLCDTEDAGIGSVAGQTLRSLADTSPSPVARQLEGVAEQLHEEYDEAIVSGIDATSATRSTLYWLLRVAARCHRHAVEGVPLFGWVLPDVLDGATPSSSRFAESTSIAGGRVSAHGLARIAARVAALGGVDCYETVLDEWPGHPRVPDPEPETVVRYLLAAETGVESIPLDTVVDSTSPPSSESVVEALLGTTQPTARSERFYDVLRVLLPHTESTALHRRGVSRLLDTVRDDNWAARRRAIDTLARLGETHVVAADEALAHLIDATDGGQRGQSPAASALVDLLPHAEVDADYVFGAAVTRCERRAAAPKRVESAVRLVGQLAYRHERFRERAATTLVDVLADSDRWTRDAAATEIERLHGVDSAVFGPYEDRLARLDDSFDA